MSYEDGIQVDSSLYEEAAVVKSCKDKRSALLDRLQEQRAVVVKAQEMLAQLVNDRSTNDPEAKAACKAQARNVDDEQEVLEAIEIAVRACEENVFQAEDKLAQSIRETISRAAKKHQGKVRCDLLGAMGEYFACFNAIKGTFIGAQYEVEQLTFDRSLTKNARERYQAVTHRIGQEIGM